jgi:hypothetical protein
MMFCSHVTAGGEPDRTSARLCLAINDVSAKEKPGTRSSAGENEYPGFLDRDESESRVFEGREGQIKFVQCAGQRETLDI